MNKIKLTDDQYQDILDEIRNMQKIQNKILNILYYAEITTKTDQMKLMREGGVNIGL